MEDQIYLLSIEIEGINIALLDDEGEIYQYTDYDIADIDKQWLQPDYEGKISVVTTDELANQYIYRNGDYYSVKER